MPIVLHTGNFEMFKWGIDNKYLFIYKLIPLTKVWGTKEMTDYLNKNMHKANKWVGSVYKGAWEKY